MDDCRTKNVEGYEKNCSPNLSTEFIRSSGVASPVLKGQVLTKGGGGVRGVIKLEKPLFEEVAERV